MENESCLRIYIPKCCISLLLSDPWHNSDHLPSKCKECGSVHRRKDPPKRVAMSISCCQNVND